MDWKKDKTLWALVGSNLLTLVFAFFGNWSIHTIMWIYWSQSVIIGVFNVIKIINTKARPKGPAPFQRLPPNIPQWAVKYPIATFFAIHYGGFHLGYMIFLLASTFGGAPIYSEIPVSWLSVLAFSGLFAWNHHYSYQKNWKKDISKHKEPMQMMAGPYARIIPMHITIIFGAIFQEKVIVLFLLLKTFADALMHVREHR